MQETICDETDTGLTPGDFACRDREERIALENGRIVAPEKYRDALSEPGLLLVAEGDNDGKTFPWRQIMGALKRIVPEVSMPSAGQRRDALMKKFWRDHGKTIAAFEVLAAKVRESDYLMARGGHVGNGGRPFSWGWIFGKTGKNELRAERVLEGAYSNDAMAFVLERAAAAKEKPTLVVLCGSKTPIQVNLSEVWQGAPRYKQCDTNPSGLPVVIDYKD